jgi:hypothetical protein
MLTLKFPKRVFFWSGIYGVFTLVPLYFVEDMLGRMSPPAINHPEQFYGFIGVALAWQFAFLLIAKDVLRYRWFMLPAAAEKLLAAGSAFILYANHRIETATLMPAMVDMLLCLLFLLSFYVCHKYSQRNSSSDRL